eukprot:ANDGO_01155.mRNA.1 hypothetical protein
MVRELTTALLDAEGNYRKFITNPQFRGGWQVDVFNPLEYYETAKSYLTAVYSVLQLAILLMLFVLFSETIPRDTWFGMAFFVSIIARLVINATTYNPLHILFRRWRLLHFSGPMVTSENFVDKGFLVHIYEAYSRWIDWLPIIVSKNSMLRIVYCIWLLFFFLVTILSVVFSPTRSSSNLWYLWIIVPLADFVICSRRMLSGGAVERNDPPFDILGEYNVSKTVSVSSNMTITTTCTDAQVYFLESITDYDPMQGGCAPGSSAARVANAVTDRGDPSQYPQSPPMYSAQPMYPQPPYGQPFPLYAHPEYSQSLPYPYPDPHFNPYPHPPPAPARAPASVPASSSQRTGSSTPPSAW